MFTVSQDYELQPYKLVNLPNDGTFDEFDDKQEEIALRELLGNLFYDALSEGIESLPEEWEEGLSFDTDKETIHASKVWKSTTDANVSEPDSSGDWEELPLKTRWLLIRDGANYTPENTKVQMKWWGMVDMLKPLIHSLWEESTVMTIPGSGRTLTQKQNAENVTPIRFICNAWNAYADKAGYCNSLVNTLFGYLYTNATEFDDLVTEYSSFQEYLLAEFCAPEHKNSLDI